MKPFAKERWCTENKWRQIRKFKKPVMFLLGAYIKHDVHCILYIETDYYSNSHVSFSNFYFRRSSGCPIAWFKVRLLFFQTSSIQFSDIVDDLAIASNVDDLAIASTFGVHVVFQALDPRYVFLFKLRAPTLLTLSTTLGLHLDSCTMWFYFFWLIQT